LTREPLPDDWRDDARRGLSIIATRSEGLSRFLGAYALLAKLPPPRPEPVEVGTWIQRSASLEQRLAATVRPGPDLTIQGDRDQLEQVMINLLRNAVDASLETGGSVAVTWKRKGAQLEVSVQDEGPGLSNTATCCAVFHQRREGRNRPCAGRQIAEAAGTLELRKRQRMRRADSPA
jgi:signal transduction histidine kinase